MGKNLVSFSFDSRCRKELLYGTASINENDAAFLPREAMLARYWLVRPYVRLYDCLSVTSRLDIEMATGIELVLELRHPSTDTIRYDTRCYFNFRSKADIRKSA